MCMLMQICAQLLLFELTHSACRQVERPLLATDLAQAGSRMHTRTHTQTHIHSVRATHAHGHPHAHPNTRTHARRHYRAFTGAHTLKAALLNDQSLQLQRMLNAAAPASQGGRRGGAGVVGGEAAQTAAGSLGQ